MRIVYVPCVWIHTGRLAHVLAPRCYFDPQHHARELEVLFAGGWHCLATRGALARPGQFITAELLGEPVLVRNCDGELRAFQNVCAHRHAQLVREPRGESPRIRCQYHGWEYDADGRSRKVPDARSFIPLRRGGECLRQFRVASCGQLVFVSLAQDGPGLRAALGEPIWAVLEAGFGDDHIEVGAWTFEHAANWKVPVENGVESYHVPVLHPRTFKQLSKASDATHTLAPTFTALEKADPLPATPLRWVSDRWRVAPSRIYTHHHVFPNLLVARTDISALVQVVLPTSPTSSRTLAFCFVHRGDAPRLAPRVFGPIVGELLARFTHKVLREDDAVFASVQRGLRSSRHPGVLGAREERVHAFQCYVERALGV
jgi:phenylpropionate dioxygenase-like ring-hydroxylating dioxygenase large terminal subunit